MGATFDVTGSGPAIVFAHAAIGDRRMWDPQWTQFAATNTVVRVDLCGFGDNPPREQPFSHRADILDILDRHEIQSAVFVGASMGARVSLEIAVESPERVGGLLLIGPGVTDHDWSVQVQSFWQIEADALDAGALDAAVEANIDFWVDGPARDRARLTAADRELVATMQRRAFEHELAHPNACADSRLDDLTSRMAEIAAPTTVLYGDEDATDIAAIAHRLAEAIPEASLHIVADTAHLPSLEAPGEINGYLSQLLLGVNELLPGSADR